MFTQQTQIPRSPLASTLTLAFHAGLGLVVIGLVAMPSIPRVHQTESLVYIPAAVLPDLRFEVPAPPPPAPPPPAPRLEAPCPEPPKAVAAPVIERPVPPAPAPAPAPPPVATPERRVVEPPREVPAPVKPAVTVGAFADNTAVARRERVTEVATTDFDAKADAAVRARREVQAIDGFATATSQTAVSRAKVSDAGFGGASAPATQARAAVTTGASGFSTDAGPSRPAATAPRTTASAGFGADVTARPAPVTPRAGTQAAGFAAEAAPAPKPVVAPPPPRADRQVEILYKPTPAYTPDARAQRIEGEVTLEVEFTAAGEVRVLRVVRGLGYGLDEMAERAAAQIRFKPATSRGTPVDVRVNLTILFRLT